VYRAVKKETFKKCLTSRMPFDGQFLKQKNPPG